MSDGLNTTSRDWANDAESYLKTQHLAVPQIKHVTISTDTGLDNMISADARPFNPTSKIYSGLECHYSIVALLDSGIA